MFFGFSKRLNNSTDSLLFGDLMMQKNDSENSKKKVYFVTGNKNKIDMFNKVVSEKLLVESFEPSEEIEELESRSVKEVVVDKLNKALNYFPKEDVYLFVTDVGIYIEQLNGAPGALIKRETKKLFGGDFHKWCAHLDSSKIRNAYVQVIIAAKNKEGKEIFVDHKVQGIIPETPLPGTYGFAWDDIFVPREDLVPEQYRGKSFAQIPESEKLKVFMFPPIKELERKIFQSDT